MFDQFQIDPQRLMALMAALRGLYAYDDDPDISRRERLGISRMHELNEAFGQGATVRQMLPELFDGGPPERPPSGERHS